MKMEVANFGAAMDTLIDEDAPTPTPTISRMSAQYQSLVQATYVKNINTEGDIHTAEAILNFIELRSLPVDDANITNVLNIYALHNLYIFVGDGVSSSLALFAFKCCIRPIHE